VALDYNGTLSDDEALLEGVYLQVLADAGAPITSAAYRDHLLGLPDAEMVARGRRLGGLADPGAALCRRVLAQRRERYTAAVAAQPTISSEAIGFVRTLSRAVPLAVVSGAPREEVERGLRVAGIERQIAVVVAAEDVKRGKPDPEPYLTAHRLLGRVAASLTPQQVLGVEDSVPGVAAIHAAGMRSAAVAPGLGAEFVLRGLDAAAARRLLRSLT
jgi:HAD superfamily hydrolase (TIGR01509 family)